MGMKSLSRQVGGKHYQNEGIEPAEYIIKNKLPFAEGNAIKYISRHKDKGGKEDLLKAVHYIEMILEDSYGVGLDGKPLNDGFECTLDVDLSHHDPSVWSYFAIGSEEDLHRFKQEIGEYEDMKEYCQS